MNKNDFLKSQIKEAKLLYTYEAQALAILTEYKKKLHVDHSQLKKTKRMQVFWHVATLEPGLCQVIVNGPVIIKYREIKRKRKAMWSQQYWKSFVKTTSVEQDQDKYVLLLL